MARGAVAILSPQSRSIAAITSFSSIWRPLPTRKPSNDVVSLLCRCPRTLPSVRFLCKCSGSSSDAVEMLKFREAFSRRMAMAGLKPCHRIALGVSGGSDSMALCILMANWKTQSDGVARDNGGFIDGLLAITVDHGLRPESKEEAHIVHHWISDMGIRCVTASCDWPDGLPKLGHVEAAARDQRYQILQDVCIQHQIGVLLIAHHADDQAELFILRLSRNSGVLGLGGMAFTSQLYSDFPHFYDESSNNLGILLVRPLLEFSKEDLYKICKVNNQKWVEDPTNRSSLFVRNRIRMALSIINTCIFNSELQALIADCRKTRTYVDHICHNLLRRAVTIMPHGYAVIDLEILNPSKLEHIYLSRFLALILQFISQRHRPIRGSASNLLLSYICAFPCKTSVTAAGCYLCPAPGAKGTKVLVCCSVESTLPSKTESYLRYPDQDLNHCIPYEVVQIIMEGKSYSDDLIPDASDVHFLDSFTYDSVLVEARRLNILSESTYRSIIERHTEEFERFRSNGKAASSNKSKKRELVNPVYGELFRPGRSCYFMNRFFLTWQLGMESSDQDNSLELRKCEGENHEPRCSFHVDGHEIVANIRHMIDADWLYLYELSDSQGSHKTRQQRGPDDSLEPLRKKMNLCSDYTRLSAQQALSTLKSVPVAARRGLPVLVSPEGLLLSVPGIGFKHCPCLTVCSAYKPRVPLGGGHSSFT